MAEIETPVLENLRHIRAGVDDLRADVRDVNARLGLLEAGFAGLSTRLDRIGGGVERIARLLDLTAA